MSIPISRRRVRVVLLAVMILPILLLTLAGCGRAGPASSPAAASPQAPSPIGPAPSVAAPRQTPPATRTATRRPAATPAPTLTPLIVREWQTFTSQRYAYSMQYPVGWFVREEPGVWFPGLAIYPYKAGIDTFTGAQIAPLVLVGAQPLSPTMTLAQWTADNVDAIQSQITPCEQPETTTPATLAGESALRLTYHCPAGWYAVFVFALHNTQGWNVSWESYTGNEALDTRTFERFLASFTFLKY